MARPKARVAVIGSRDFNNYIQMKDVLDKLRLVVDIVSIVSGGAKGADSLAERYADENGITKTIFEAAWSDLSHPDALVKPNKFGKLYDARAGFRRNKTIVENADVVIAFHHDNSPGTRDSINYARSLNKPIKVINV